MKHRQQINEYWLTHTQKKESKRQQKKNTVNKKREETILPHIEHNESTTTNNIQAPLYGIIWNPRHFVQQ